MSGTLTYPALFMCKATFGIMTSFTVAMTTSSHTLKSDYRIYTSTTILQLN